MLAAMYSEAQHSLDLAISQQNDELANALRGNLARYKVQSQQGPATGPNP